MVGRTDPAKVSAIGNYKTSITTTEIKRLIGMIPYYRRFIKNVSIIATPINA